VAYLSKITIYMPIFKNLHRFVPAADLRSDRTKDHPQSNLE
jgi:hypothetical protein